MTPALLYKQLQEKYAAKVNRLKQQYSRLSLLRLLLFTLFVFLLYRYSQTQNMLTIILSVTALLVFFLLIRVANKLTESLAYYKALVKCNEDEIDFLNTNISPYDAGKVYSDAHHPFSYDMDLFGNGGLFSYINRCSTVFGKETLANDLLHPNRKAIAERQQAIKELSDKVVFRQNVFAFGSVQAHEQKNFNRLLQWINDSGEFISKPLYLFLLLFPAATIITIIYGIVTGNEMMYSIITTLFVINLIILSAFAKRIYAQLSVSASVTKSLQSYQKQLAAIENETFVSPYLQQLQSNLKKGDKPASSSIHTLTVLFNNLDSIVNLVVSPVLNGLFLYHLHVFYFLGIWKKRHAAAIKPWLQVIGAIEALNSFSGFSYNNSSYCYPVISTTPALSATGLGHPLIAEKSRVCNDISFNQQRFVILTGSNMSGKSTFLRTLGVNLVLANAGSVVCARQFNFYPFDIFVSMRISDSLQDSESLFYAELKRLKAIIAHLQQGHISFVILDEILRGTNSNDKRNGTIGVIKKLIKENAFGIIATHDVIVAALKTEFPEIITDKAFESEIVNDVLTFDYKLKDGVCTKLNASFLMKKMGVIDE